MNESQYPEDKRLEELLGTWLDEHFYAGLQEKYQDITRNTDQKLQKIGVDVIIKTRRGKTLYIDEKATLHYINQHIPTFAFEIKSITSGNPGWLYNPRYITDHYLLVWPEASDVTIPDARAFTRAEIMSIKRDDVIRLLSDHGITQDSISGSIECYQDRLPKENNFPLTDGIKLNFNLTLKERPVNVVIKKNLLKRYAQYHATIS